jgi:hypothetical protein
MLETFYSTTAQISFALLGLWWVVVQFKYQRLMDDPQWRRIAYDTSLYFLLPAIMSLISLLATEAKFLWRIGFGAAAFLGLVETILMIASSRSGFGRQRVFRIVRWVVLPLYLFILIFAIRPELVSTLGIGLQPILVEAILVSLLMFLGVSFAWFVFAEPEGEG